MEAGVLGRMEKQKGLDMFKGLDERGGEGLVAGQGERQRGGQVGQGRSQVPWGKVQGRLLPVHL